MITLSILLASFFLPPRSFAAGIKSQTDLLKQDLVLVAVKLANQFDVVKSIYKQKLFTTPTTVVNVNEPNNIIETIVFGWGPENTQCNLQDGTATDDNGFTRCLVNFPGDKFTCPYDKSDHFLIEVRFKKDTTNPSVTSKRLLFVAIDASGREIKKDKIGTVDGQNMDQIKLFTCINPDGHKADGTNFINNGIRFGGVLTAGVRLQLGRGYYNDLSPELSQCLTSIPVEAVSCS